MSLKKIGYFLLCFFCLTSVQMSYGIIDSTSQRIIYCENERDCGLDTGVNKVKTALNNSGVETNKSASEYAQEVVKYIVSFVSVVALIYVIYAGIRILTSGGDEQVTKKQKANIFAVAIGIVIIWLAYPFVKWLVTVVVR